MGDSCIFKLEHITQVHKRNIDITAGISQIPALSSGNVIIRFRHSAVPSFAPLLNIVNRQYPSSYFLLYTQNSYRVGLMRKIVTENGVRTSLLNLYDDQQAQMNLLNTLACTIEEGVGYCLYLNGTLLRKYPDPEACFLRDILNLAPLRAALIGKTIESQKLDYDRAVFLGDIDFLSLYNNVLPPQEILSITAQTIPNTDVSISPGSFCSQPVKLFYPGYMDAPNYRMPSLLQTKSGTLLAAVDQRMHGPQEHPNKIHIVLRRSTDLGHSFGTGISVVTMPENSQSIDSCMLQDQDTGRIFLLTDQFAENTTLFSIRPGTGYEMIDSKLYRQLLDDNGVKYLESTGGAITCRGKSTPYMTKSNYKLLYNGVSAGYIFSERCPLRVYPTSYLVYVYSDDDGLTWSSPQPLNPSVKEDWMTFLGCSPGRGIQLRYGANAGRLLFPIYYLNSHGVQSAALIYSDDHGMTWTRGESCNDQRLFEGALYHSQTLTDKRLDTNEAQVVELPDGTVLLFAKSPFNGTGCVAVASSKDGGRSFHSTLHFEEALRSTDSLSVISCPVEIEGHYALLYAGGDSVSGSCNGAVKIGLLQHEKPQKIEWRYSRLVKPGTFGHCSLSMITDTMIGLFYESSGGLDVSFVRMDIPFLMTEDFPLHPVEIESLDYCKQGGGVLFTLRLNQPVMLCGNRTLTVKLSHRTATAQYQFRNEDCQRYHFFAPKINPQDITDFFIPANMKLFSTNGMCYVYSRKKKQLIWKYYADEEEAFFSLVSSHIDTFDDGKLIVSHDENWRSSSLNPSAFSVSPASSPVGLRCNSEQMVQRILNYVHTNYALPLTLSEIAQSINVNSSYLGRIFSKRVNQSFNDYLASYRITRARELLKDDSFMVYEISQMVGYHDINHFYKLFKHYTNMSPTSYRKRILNQS